ncbi:MAG TPA: hypothetical protein VHD57_13205 [Vicinamibacterales bacterium]|jgi:hypothetical protein|nr:hypothetical protein [Vicinamibacterales bacterium]
MSRSRAFIVRLSCLAALAAASVLPLAAQSTVTLTPDLSSPAHLSDWTVDGSGAWKIADGALVLFKAGIPGGPIRRPAGLAILKSDPLTRVTVTAEIKSDAPVNLPVRDVDVVVGYQSPSRFYYIHLAGITNDVHNGIFVVADADRRRLDDQTAKPQMKDQAWHQVRIERDPSTGAIDVFMNGGTTPVLHAVDKTLTSGRIGFGSFDETGLFRHIVVKGEK